MKEFIEFFLIFVAYAVFAILAAPWGLKLSMAIFHAMGNGYLNYFEWVLK